MSGQIQLECVEPGFLHSEEWASLPSSLKELGLSAAHRFCFGINEKIEAFDYLRLNSILDEFREQLCQERASVGLLAVMLKLEIEKEGYSEKWPNAIFRHELGVHQESLGAQVFSAFAISALRMASRRLRATDLTGALDLTAFAGHALSYAQYCAGNDGTALGNTEARRLGALNKLRADPKQLAKRGALDLWKERHAGMHPSLRRVQDFATEVMRRWPILTNAKTIEGWSAKWSKEVKEGRTPTC